MEEEENNTVDPAAEMLNEGGPPSPPAPAIDYQKLYEQAMQQNAQLAQTVQQVANRPVVVPTVPNTPAPDPFAEFEPGTAKALKSVVDTMNKQFEQKFAQQQAQFASMTLEQEAAQIASMPGLTADQVKRAQDIFRGNRAKGIPINVSECVDVVIGQDFRAGKVNLGNRQPPATLTGGGKPPAPAKARPANFDRLSRAEQIKHYEQDNALHETPIAGFWEDPD